MHSTVTRLNLEWAAQARTRAIHLLDAPITSSAPRGGGDSDVHGRRRRLVARCRPLFLTSGRKVVHAGPVVHDLLLKLCNDLMTYARSRPPTKLRGCALAGGASIADCSPRSAAAARHDIAGGTFLANRGQLAAAGKLRQAFAPFAGLARKDLVAALSSARELRVVLPSTERVAEIIEQVFLNHDH